MNDLMPRAVIGIGCVEIALTHEPEGVMVGELSMLDSKRLMYFTFDLNVWILLIVEIMPYFFNISIKLHNLSVSFDIRCKNYDVIHYAINELTNICR